MSVETTPLILDTEVGQATAELERIGFTSNRKIRLRVVDHEEAKEHLIQMIHDLQDKIEEGGMTEEEKVDIIADL